MGKEELKAGALASGELAGASGGAIDAAAVKKELKSWTPDTWQAVKNTLLTLLDQELRACGATDAQIAHVRSVATACIDNKLPISQVLVQIIGAEPTLATKLPGRTDHIKAEINKALIPFGVNI
jgi:hypothetical protein